ncbi:MAG TPA: hypothetical protein DDY31_00425 [Lachnospiraceae bacterium]|nr:hypothetical protein [Lachnospiraceae bacterium]
MKKKDKILVKIERWLNIHDGFDKKNTKKMLAAFLHISESSIMSLSVRNRCINIYTDDYMYKIQLYGDSIKRDLNNRKYFLNQRIKLLAPVKIYKKHPLVIKTPILKQSYSTSEAADYLLGKLSDHGYMKAFRVNDYPLLIAGLMILETYVYGKYVSKKISEYFQRKSTSMVRAGIVHGDFHRGNIMFKNNRPVLIDLDCARACDIQAVDALYYILEEERHKHGYQEIWLVEWMILYDNLQVIYKYRCSKWVDMDLKFGLIVLLLERIAQDQNYDPLFAENNKKVIRKINLKLLEEL